MDSLTNLLLERSRAAEDAYSSRAVADLTALHDRIGRSSYSRFEPHRMWSTHDYDRSARLRYLEFLEEGAPQSLKLDRLPDFFLTERDAGELRRALADIARDAEHFAGLFATRVVGTAKVAP